ncbi:deoxyguanosinetriphosphate triphosphohydrolase [Desulfuribacillus stibiiarsenatis]|uniref:Deoxyguanosinetriphosphate triphosphohydrolase-like protein n=1 Tax=Desulfuribacillus stibiiarsenatis TaxID=1390249 RepID=A0A1E5L856_9FIRM|nr:deoxyguanosinetriphosphate triphosphohydrolase [Desulfuribacillus stibiiarsenatis]OEH86169.1 deoxyguanosinetriphosphate triphosphohydrolase [Desulfuribacillus stibiiarsenatis]
MKRNWDDIEAIILSPYACKSKDTKGRRFADTRKDLRTEFQRDRDRIIHSKAFRRLKHKTQVFITPEGDHYRTRLTHTLEVSQIARTIARGLGLNEDLTESIALGHDLGHTPFGHAGETVLDRIHPEGFRHNEQSLRVVDWLEDGKGLNLTWEVRDGILNHTGPNKPFTLEGQVVKIADRIAYINHDIDDAIRGKVLTYDDLPKELMLILGSSHSERISAMVHDMIRNSEGKEEISLSGEITQAMNELRKFMFQYVYISSDAKKEEEKAKRIVEAVYLHYLTHPELLHKEYHNQIQDNNIHRTVCDFVAGMTDRYIITLYKKIVIPDPWLIV